MSNFIGVVWFVFKSAIILGGGGGVETWNLPMLLVFMCCTTGITDKEFWDDGFKNQNSWWTLIWNNSVLFDEFLSSDWLLRLIKLINH